MPPGAILWQLYSPAYAVNSPPGGGSSCQKSLPLESPCTLVVQQPGQRCPFVVRAFDPEAYPVEDKLLPVFNCRAIVAAFDVECVCLRVLFYCLDMHVLEGSTVYLFCNVAGLHFFHRDRSLSFNAPFFIKTSFLETLLFRAREERKVYRDRCPCTPLAGAAFDQSGNWPVKAGFWPVSGDCSPIFPSPLTLAETTN
jgi:hypothetical protein